jgi:hypothetical protein
VAEIPHALALAGGRDFQLQCMCFACDSIAVPGTIPLKLASRGSMKSAALYARPAPVVDADGAVPMNTE